MADMLQVLFLPIWQIEGRGPTLEIYLGLAENEER